MTRTDLKIGLLMLLVAILYGYAKLHDQGISVAHHSYSDCYRPPIQKGLSSAGQPLGAQPTQ